MANTDLSVVVTDAAQIEIDADRTIAKVARRLVPFLVACFFAAYLDRVNVGFAALSMNADLGFSRRFSASAPASSSSAIRFSRRRAISFCIASARAAGSPASW